MILEELILKATNVFVHNNLLIIDIGNKRMMIKDVKDKKIYIDLFYETLFNKYGKN